MGDRVGEVCCPGDLPGAGERLAGDADGVLSSCDHSAKPRLTSSSAILTSCKRITKYIVFYIIQSMYYEFSSGNLPGLLTPKWGGPDSKMLTIGVIKHHDNSRQKKKASKTHNFISSAQAGLPTENSGSPWQFLVVGLPLIHALYHTS